MYSQENKVNISPDFTHHFIIPLCVYVRNFSSLVLVFGGQAPVQNRSNFAHIPVFCLQPVSGGQGMNFQVIRQPVCDGTWCPSDIKLM